MELSEDYLDKMLNFAIKYHKNEPNEINKITLNWKMNYKIILTGGYAKFFKKIIKKNTLVDQNITIKGVSRVYKELL